MTFVILPLELDAALRRQEEVGKRMIEKMEFLSIIGPKDQLDRVTEKYLGKYEIQLENTVGELKNLKNIVPSSESNPYREWIGKAQEAATIVTGPSRGTGQAEKKQTGSGMSPQEAVEIIQRADRLMEESRQQKTKLETELKKKQSLLEAVRPYLELHFELSRILHFKYVRFRFGRLPVSYYQRLKDYLQEDDCTIFEKCRVDESYVWGIYFVPASEAKKADAIYASMHFERIFIEDAYQGTVDEACQTLEKEIETLAQEEKSLDEIFATKYENMKDCLEAKLFGIGLESYTVGSYDFYLGYGAKKQKIVTLDTGHFHLTESIADKISALLLFIPEIMLHVSRPIRWDSDHVVILNDELMDLSRELVRCNALDRVHIGLDYFDATINRIGAYVIGVRATQKALLQALLEPSATLQTYEAKDQLFQRLALQEELKSMPWNAVWDMFCLKNNVPVGENYLTDIEKYEAEVTNKRG